MKTQWRTEIRNGGEKWFIVSMAELAFRIDDDGRATGAFLAVAEPYGGIIGGWPALAQGEQGFSPTLVMNSFLELPADDETPASANIVELVPGVAGVSGPVFGLDLVLHRGATSEGGTLVLDPADYAETPLAGQSLVVNSAADGFELVTPKVPAMLFPASITSAPSGSTAEFTMAVINITAGTYNRDMMIDPRGSAVVVGSTSDVRVDLIVRLNDETGGAIVGRGRGQVAAKWQPTIQAGVESGTGIIPAGDAAVLYFRTKKISGAATYLAAAADASYSALLIPV